MPRGMILEVELSLSVFPVTRHFFRKKNGARRKMQNKIKKSNIFEKKIEKKNWKKILSLIFYLKFWSFKGYLISLNDNWHLWFT